MSYFSSANSSIFMNGIQVNEANGLEVNKDYGAVPVYSWNRRNWDFLAEGKIIVTGSLILNVSSVDYLMSLLEENTNLPSIEEANRNATKNIEDIKQALQIAQDTISSGGGTIQQVLDVARMKKAILQPGNTDTIDIDGSNSIINTKLSTIVVKNNNNNVTELIEGIRFTGKSFTHQAGSSQNIKYAFPFVARDSSI